MTIHPSIISGSERASRTLRVGLLGACFLVGAARAAVPVEPLPTPDNFGETYADQGRGLSLHDAGLTLGGYGAASVSDDQGDPAQLQLDSLSLFLWWDSSRRWSFFGEVELNDALIVQRRDVTVDETSLILERLHADYAISDAVKFRIGKFLTPVGRWNVLHAAPLTWTTSRPLITEATFPTNASGLMFYGGVPLLGQPFEYSLYASPGQELVPAEGIDTFEEAYGLHLSYGLGASAQVGASWLSFEQRSQPDERRVLFGLDFLWTLGGVELSGEWARRTRNGDTARGDERGYYVQGVVPIAGRVFGVLRYETFTAIDGDEALHFYLGGLTWRPNASLVLKGEYTTGIENEVDAPEGFRASLALLF